jgi:hypothetical protein
MDSRARRIMCWLKLLVAEEATTGPLSGSSVLGPALEHGHVVWLNRHLRLGTRLVDVLGMVHHLCLRLQYSILRRQALEVHSSRSDIKVDDAGSGKAFALRVSYWASPTVDRACTFEIALRSSCIQIFDLPCPSIGTRATCTVDPGCVSFSTVLTAVMKSRARGRILRLHKTLMQSEKNASTDNAQIHVPAESDSDGLEFVVARLSSATFEFHIRRSNGLLILRQVTGWRESGFLSEWQEKLNEGAGIFDMESAKIILPGLQRQLYFHDVVSQARAIDLFVTKLCFETSSVSSDPSARLFGDQLRCVAYIRMPNGGLAKESYFLALAVSSSCEFEAALASAVPCQCAGTLTRYRLRSAFVIEVPKHILRATCATGPESPLKRQAVQRVGSHGSFELCRATEGTLSDTIQQTYLEATEAVGRLRR